MTYEHILANVEDGVAILTLNRPESLNAMNRKLVRELHDALKSAEADDGVGCIVITGAGEKAFSAGGDIKEQLSDDAQYTEDQLDAMRNRRPSYDIAASKKPTIGMMNGLAFGGAAVLASSLDMRIGCEATKFRFLAAAYGRINSTWTLPNQVGWPIAKELLFSARVVEAEEAYRIGLLNHLVPRAQLREENDVACEDDRREPSRRGGRHQGAAAQADERKPRRAVRFRKGIHLQGVARCQGEGCISRVHRPQGIESGMRADAPG